MKIFFPALFLALSLSGCVSVNGTDFCAISGEHRFYPDEWQALDEATKDREAAHNLAVQELCG